MDKQEKHLGSSPEDVEDVLRLIERSYDIRFEGKELEHIRTFGELTDYIIAKIKLEEKTDCTDQQAFYKLRSALGASKDVNGSRTSPETQLAHIFPVATRRKQIKEIEKQLGVDLKALRPRYWVTNFLMIVLLLSIVSIFMKWQLGLSGFLFSIGGLWISEKTAREFKDKTLGQLADRMTQLNYVKSRRHPGTMNSKEIRSKIEKLFIDNLGLDTETIDRDARYS
jgi:acyl carrier protein